MGQEPQGHAGTSPEGLSSSPPPGQKGDDDAHLGGPGDWALTGAVGQAGCVYGPVGWDLYLVSNVGFQSSGE